MNIDKACKNNHIIVVFDMQLLIHGINFNGGFGPRCLYGLNHLSMSYYVNNITYTCHHLYAGLIIIMSAVCVCVWACACVCVWVWVCVRASVCVSWEMFIR